MKHHQSPPSPPLRLLRTAVATPRRLFVTLLVLLAAPIIVAFLLFEAPLLAWTENLLDERGSPNAVALMATLLLATDVLLPIPSSVVATVVATLVDPVRGVLAIVVGTSLSASIGWCLGGVLRGTALDRLVDQRALSEADHSFQRWGLWGYAVTRAVPILAEEFAILAGAHRIPYWRVFLPLTLAASLPMALFYIVAVKSARLADDASPPFWLLAVIASALPVLGLASAQLLRWRRRQQAKREEA